MNEFPIFGRKGSGAEWSAAVHKVGGVRDELVHIQFMLQY